MVNRLGLTIIDNSVRYPFTVAKDPQKQGRDYSIDPIPWEQGDPKTYWKEELHPWDGGLGSDRFTDPANYFGSTRTKAPRRYAKANADLSNRGLLVPPPLLTSISGSNFSVVYKETFSGTDTAKSTITLSVEAGLIDLRPGDVIIGIVNTQDANGSASTIDPTNITAIATMTDNDNGVAFAKSRVFYKVYTSGIVNYVFDFTGQADFINYQFLHFRGVDTVNPINISANFNTIVQPNMLPTSANCMIVEFSTGNSTGSVTASPPGFTTATQTDVGAAPGSSLRSAYILQTTAVNTNTYTNFTSTAGLPTQWAIALNRLVITFVAGFNKFVNFNSKTWAYSDNALVSINGSYVLTIEAIFASITDIAVFNNELILAFGYSTKIWKATAATPEVFTQASDNTYAGKLATVGKNLWRSTAAASISSCTTAPLTLTSWGTSYTPGNTTYDINILIEYGGVIWVGKADGFYAPDVNTNFWNQTPQLLQWPDSANCTGAFVAKGFLWCPSTAGLIRIRQGESLVQGPELSQRPSYQFWVRGGVEWAGSLYLIANDRAAVSQSCVIKMTEDDVNASAINSYIYHEWCRLGSTIIPYAIGITINTTNPSILIGHGTVVKYIKLGRGGGREIDDPNYAFGASWELETGGIKPNQDMSLVTGLIGITIVCDEDADETIDSIQYKVENESSFHNMLTTSEGGGTMSITNTSGYAAITRYAPPDTIGQFFNFYLAGSFTDTCLGTDRPEIREVWAFGFVRPRQTDLIKIPILASQNAVAGNGLRQGRTAGQTRAMLNRWLRDGTQFTFELADYEESRTTRGRVIGVEEQEIDIIEGTSGIEKRETILMVSIQRDDLAGSIYNA